MLAIGASCLASIALVFAVQRGAELAAGQSGGKTGRPWKRSFASWSWAVVNDASTAGQAGHQPEVGRGTRVMPGSHALSIDVALRADPLTAVMLAMVTFVSLLVAVYSIGYMHGDPGYWRFFTYIALFVFSMTMLVSASNFVLLYVFWEAVGLCSYLLIGFWFEKPAAAAAGKKAFMVNRVGDFGFALGVFLLWTTYGTLDFHDTTVAGVVHPGIFGQAMLAHPSLYAGGGAATAICLLLMLGACGKSASSPCTSGCPTPWKAPRPSAPDSCGHYGHGGRLHGGPLHAAVCGIARRPARRGRYRRVHGPDGRPDRPDPDRSEANTGLFDDQPTRLHVPGPGRRHAPGHYGRACFTW